MDVTQKRSELEAKHEAQRIALEREIAVYAALPDALAAFDWSVHMHRLYDRDGSASIRLAYAESLRKYPDPTLHTVRALWNAFPGVPLARYNDSCVGIRTLADAQMELSRAEARNPETNAEVIPISPFWLELDRGTYGRAHVTFHWVATVGHLQMEFRVEQPTTVTDALGSHVVTYEYAGRGENRRVVGIASNRFDEKPECRVLGNGRMEQTRYSSGDRKTPGSILLYWNSCDGDNTTADVPMLLDKVAL